MPLSRRFCRPTRTEPDRARGNISVLCAWWVCTTVVGVAGIAVVAHAVMERGRAQSCADAVALALVSRAPSSVAPLLDALDSTLVVVEREGGTVTVEVDTPWGRSRAMASTGA